jgi:hypothetical protein
MQHDIESISKQPESPKQPKKEEKKTVFKRKHLSVPAKNYGNGKLRTITILKD